MRYKSKPSEEPLPKVQMLDSKEVDRKDMEKVMAAALLMDIPVAETLDGITEPAIKIMSCELMKGAVNVDTELGGNYETLAATTSILSKANAEGKLNLAAIELIKLAQSELPENYREKVVKLAKSI